MITISALGFIVGFRVQGSRCWVRSGFRVQSPGAGFASAFRMIAQRYQELDCWQLSNDLKLRVYAFARYLEFARASLMETQNHLGDARDSRYITNEEHDELFKLADRAIGASTRLHHYLKTCKQWPGSKHPRTPNRGTKNPEPGTKNEP
jgi:hypothetical protein